MPHGGHPRFPLGTILLFFLSLYKSPWCFPPSFKSTGLSVQKKRKIDFQDGGHLGFLRGTILAFLTYKSLWYFLPRFKSISLLVQEKKPKIDFQDGPHSHHLGFQDGCHGPQLWFPIGTILAIFDLKVIPMLPTKFRVNWPFGSGVELKKKQIFKLAAMAAILGFQMELF